MSLKPIRYAATAFLTWAVITYSWAALSHMAGFIGPAEASRASLDFLADAVELLEPPGVLAAPQRFAASQIRGGARSAEAVHAGAERASVRFVDWLGHAEAHRRCDRRHRHGCRGGRDAGFDEVVIRLDDFGQARERARQMAVIELERHRERADRARDRAERRLEARQRRMERQLDRTRVRIEGRLERAVPELDMRLWVGGEAPRIMRGGEMRDRWVLPQALPLEPAGLEDALEGLAGELEAALDGLETELEAALDRDDLRRLLEEIRDILDDLDDDR